MEEPVDPEVERIRAVVAREQAVQPVKLVIAAVRSYRYALQTWLTREVGSFQAQRTLASLIKRQGDLVEDYVRAAGSAHALVQVAATLDPTLLGLGQDDQEAIVMEHAMTETAGRAGERLTGLIGGLIDHAATVATQDTQITDAHDAAEIAGREANRAGAELEAAVYSAEQTLASHVEFD
nr:hypothetical protein [Longispora sp. (in: high G+C Gram-positive bacteria)]